MREDGDGLVDKPSDKEVEKKRKTLRKIEPEGRGGQVRGRKCRRGRGTGRGRDVPLPGVHRFQRGGRKQ